MPTGARGKIPYAQSHIVAAAHDYFLVGLQAADCVFIYKERKNYETANDSLDSFSFSPLKRAINQSSVYPPIYFFFATHSRTTVPRDGEATAAPRPALSICQIPHTNSMVC